MNSSYSAPESQKNGCSDGQNIPETACLSVGAVNTGWAVAGRLLLGLWICFVFCSPALADYSAPSVQYAMFGDPQFVEEKYSFSPDDVIYIVLHFPDINAGNHIITTEWIDPWGGVERQNVYRLSLQDRQENYRVCSWLQLWKNGYVSRAMTGREYDDKFYGVWKVRVYLDGRPVAEKNFKIA